MNSINYLEWIGYIGSIIVAISLTMTSMIKLRWLNFIGALIFTIYGIAIHAIPVALVNGFITVIDVYYLFKMYTTKDYFKLLEIKPDNEYLDQFIAYYKTSIEKEYPQFTLQDSSNAFACLILRNMTIAGVFIGTKTNNESLEIDLDFAIPPYQDFKTGDYLFNRKKSIFIEKGFKSIVVSPYSKALKNYYTKMGFIDDQGIFTKHL